MAELETCLVERMSSNLARQRCSNCVRRDFPWEDRCSDLAGKICERINECTTECGVCASQANQNLSCRLTELNCEGVTDCPSGGCISEFDRLNSCLSDALCTCPALSIIPNVCQDEEQSDFCVGVIECRCARDSCSSLLQKALNCQASLCPGYKCPFTLDEIPTTTTSPNVSPTVSPESQQENDPVCSDLKQEFTICKFNELSVVAGSECDACMESTMDRSVENCTEFQSLLCDHCQMCARCHSEGQAYFACRHGMECSCSSTETESSLGIKSSNIPFTPLFIGLVVAAGVILVFGLGLVLFLRSRRQPEQEDSHEIPSNSIIVNSQGPNMVQPRGDTKAGREVVPLDSDDEDSNTSTPSSWSNIPDNCRNEI